MSHDTDRHGPKLGCLEAEAFSILESEALTCFKAMDDIGVVMTSFGDVVTVNLVANSYVVDFFSLKSGVVEKY